MVIVNFHMLLTPPQNKDFMLLGYPNFYDCEMLLGPPVMDNLRRRIHLSEVDVLYNPFS